MGQGGGRQPADLFLGFAQDLHESGAVATVAVENGVDQSGFGHGGSSKTRY
jgi:hypothetical protein